MITIQVIQQTGDRWGARFAGSGWKTVYGNSIDEALGALLWNYQWKFCDEEGVEIDLRLCNGGRQVYGTGGRLEWQKRGIT